MAKHLNGPSPRPRRLVLITGDDLARLDPRFLTDNDPDYEKKLTPQARPNVLFEAGMAFGRHPERTILVRLGHSREFSDVAGRNEIRMSNRAEARQELVDRLKTAGCDVKPTIEQPGLVPAILTPPYTSQIAPSSSQRHPRGKPWRLQDGLPMLPNSRGTCFTGSSAYIRAVATPRLYSCIQRRAAPRSCCTTVPSPKSKCVPTSSISSDWQPSNSWT